MSLAARTRCPRTRFSTSAPSFPTMAATAERPLTVLGALGPGGRRPDLFAQVAGQQAAEIFARVALVVRPRYGMYAYTRVELLLSPLPSPPPPPSPPETATAHDAPRC